jgi:hypothetical protein
MNRYVVMAAVVLACAGRVFANQDSSTTMTRLGVGVQYWTAVEDIDVDEVDENGLSWYLSYQMAPSPYFKMELDFEMLPDGYGGAPETVYAPQFFLVVGNGLYAAAGIGIYYTDGEFVEDPFYALRVGLDAEVLPFLRLDLNVNYRFEDWDNLDDESAGIDTDTVMLGLAARLCF